VCLPLFHTSCRQSVRDLSITKHLIIPGVADRDVAVMRPDLNVAVRMLCAICYCSETCHLLESLIFTRLGSQIIKVLCVSGCDSGTERC